MSFQKNPPWQKNVPNVIPTNFQQQMSIQQFQNQQQQLINAFQQQQQFQPFHNPIIYPNPNNRINALAFQQSQQPQQQAAAQPANQISSPQSTHNSQSAPSSSKYNTALKTFSGTGLVSKVQNDIGFIDDEVLFHKNVCVKGLSPKLGDRVLVEAAYNQNMPFKWNATRVQVLSRSNTSTSNSVENNKSYSHQHDNDSYRSARNRYSSERDRRNDRRPRSRDNRDTDEENDRKRRRGGGDDREKPRQRDSMEYGRDRTKSPLRRTSPPKRRRAHNTPRYMVQIPKVSLSLSNIDVMEVKKRYPNLYIPSDFTSSENIWSTAFPLNKPFTMHRPCSFHIMKDVNPIDETIAQCVLDPSDADYTWSAKVMLLSIPAIHELYKKCIIKAEDEKHDDSDKDFIHPSRLISFLVGVRGKNETMAIGGPWSKKLDGENPESDPSVLIRTAIRTCKGLTGIDLSNCTQWYRFVELKYRRSEQNKKEGSESSARPARIETVVIFLPDIHSCMPNRMEWDGVHQQYKMALEKFLTANNDDVVSKDKQKVADVVEGAGNVVKVADEEKSAAELSNIEAKRDQVEDEVMADSTAANVAEMSDGGTQNDIPIDLDGEDSKQDSTIALDPKNMKVTELRAELSARNLSTKGLKNELVERLEQALKDPVSFLSETNAELMQQDENEITSSSDKIDENLQKDQEMDMNIAEMDISEVTVIDEYDSTKCDEQEEKANSKKKNETKKIDEKERQMWEKRYQLPENPHIIVHPSKTAKNGKFDCTVASLSVLLDYRKDDTKEHSFEIALFAEAFNEMLMRDFGYNIYKAFNYLSVNSKQKENSKEDDKKKETSTEVETIDTEKSNDATEKDDDKHKSKKSGDSDDQSDQSRKRDKDRSVKYITAYPDLLFSFNYFDQTQCGYIFEKDIEELFFALGLRLSRSQIRKLTEKFITRDSLYYRKITDRQVDSPIVNPYDNVTDEQLAQLALGNKLPKKNALKKDAEIVSKANSDIVTFEGSTINLHQVMHQMKRAEAAYEENEKLLADLKKSNAELKNLNHKNEKRIKDLNADLKSVSRKLQDTESNLSSVNRKYNECYSALSSINDRIAPIIARNERSRDREKEKEKSERKSDKKLKEENKSSEKSGEKSVKSEKKDVKEEQNISTSEKEKEVEEAKEKEPEVKQETV